MTVPPFNKVVPGVIAVQKYNFEPPPTPAYIVINSTDKDNILIKRLDNDYTKITDIDCLYEHYMLYNSELEYLLYHIQWY